MEKLEMQAFIWNVRYWFFSGIIVNNNILHFFFLKWPKHTNSYAHIRKIRCLQVHFFNPHRVTCSECAVSLKIWLLIQCAILSLNKLPPVLAGGGGVRGVSGSKPKSWPGFEIEPDRNILQNPAQVECLPVLLVSGLYNVDMGKSRLGIWAMQVETIKIQNGFWKLICFSLYLPHKK